MRTLRCCFVLLAVGCQWFGASGERGSGKTKTETRELPAFTKVSLEGALRAEIAAGSPQLVELTGDDNIVPLIATEVSDAQLRVRPKQSVQPKVDLVARIATPTLTALSVSGSAAVKVAGVSGDALAIDCSGSATVVATGTARKFTAHVSGAADIDATQLAAEDVTVKVSGSGDLDVTATGILDVEISGSGRVRYHGTPREVRKSISGSGTVEPK